MPHCTLQHNLKLQKSGMSATERIPHQNRRQPNRRPGTLQWLLVYFHHFSTKLPQKCRARACLRAAQKKESHAWLNVPPSSLGLHMEDTVITTAVGLRLGTLLCLEHICQQCGQDVDVSGTHGLSCQRSQGRIPRNSALNNIIKCSLAAINIRATLGPKGLCCGDGRRSDGVTIFPWKS